MPALTNQLHVLNLFLSMPTGGAEVLIAGERVWIAEEDECEHRDGQKQKNNYLARVTPGTKKSCERDFKDQYFAALRK